MGTALFVLTDQKEIQKAQQEFVSRLSEICDTKIPVKLGYKGGYEDCSIFWSKALGLWFYSRKIAGSRYWNAFGLSQVAPRKNSMLSIICEINPPIRGFDRRVQGAFVQDHEGHIWLVHRGRIGGGRPGIGRRLFFENYQGKVLEIEGDRFAIIGDISSAAFVERVKAFVQEIERIKSLAT